LGDPAQLAPADQAVALAHAANNQLVEATAASPARLSELAALPWQDPQAAAAELDRSGWGWHHEAGIHVLRLILSGAFEKYPSLQVISGRWGEMVPFYLQRLDDMLPPKVTGLSQTITEPYLNHVWVTPSGMFNLTQFQFIHAVIGADRIIWSVDYPYLTLDGTREFIRKLPGSERDREKITHQNAEKLFTL
jgi:predicted TIM-barrel fold metal-dependent hydrolase